MDDFVLRQYQGRTVKRAVDTYDEGLESALAVSPTGSGKTLMGLALAKALQVRDPELAVVWVALSSTLLRQALEENQRVQVSNFFVVSAFAREPGDLVAQFDRVLLILDEAHHGPCDTVTSVIEDINPVFIFGLSATPMRQDNLKICFQRMIIEANYANLIREGYLATFAHYTIPRYDVATVARVYTETRQRWGKTAMYFATIAECLACEALLAKSGVRSIVVTKDTDRGQQIEDFVAGRGEVILSVNMLTEGWNCPSLQTVFVRDGSQPVTEQIAGRVLRTHPDILLKQVVQSKQTPWPFPKTVLPVISYTFLKFGVWSEIVPNPSILDEAVRAADLRMGSFRFELDPFSTSALSELHNKAARARRARRLDQLTEEEKKEISALD